MNSERERNVIFVLGYSDDLSEAIQNNILKKYDIFNGYSVGYYNSLHETIKFIFSTESNILLYATYMPLKEIKIIRDILNSENIMGNNFVIYNYVDDLIDCSTVGKNNYYDKYNPIDYCDEYIEENIATGFFKIYNNHVSKVKRLCDIFACNLIEKVKKHDSDKIIDDEILKAYAIYYPELKKIPYYEEDNITRNKEYLEYEEKYMAKSMSNHCTYQDHHYYDWKNMNNPTLMDMIEAIYDVYTAITIGSPDEELDLERFVKIIKSKGILDNIEEKVINTIIKTNTGDKIIFKEKDYLKTKLNSGKYTKLTKKDALEYIKNRNEIYYNNIINHFKVFDTMTLKEDGYFYRIYRKFATINVYINKENENDIIITQERIEEGYSPKIIKLR